VAEKKSEEDSARLEWPPRKEDLERLYLEQRLSAAKIAKAYGLQYASPKTAESTVLYHLKRNGISRRDPAEHIRKVSETMVDEWILRYQRGESLKQIAGESINPVTVFNHLHTRGIQLRDKVEAQIKSVRRFEKAPFDGDAYQKGYLLGLARGDLNVKRHGRAIRVRTASTHPAMIDLLTSLMVPHGPVRVRPRLSTMVGYEWSFESELDASFGFLLEGRLTVPVGVQSVEFVLGYLAGLFDAEGSLWLRADRPFEPRMSFSNKNLELLLWVQSSLSMLGFHAHLGKPDSNGVSQLQLWRVEEILSLLKTLRLRHPERKAKVKIIFEPIAPELRHERWELLLSELKTDKAEFLKLAESVLAQKGNGSSKLRSMER
jgi:hypothetical protein